MIATLRRGFGWDVERESEIPWRIARKLRLPLSKWLRIGQWFGPGEECRKCGIPAADAEFAFRRVGFGKAECLRARGWGTRRMRVQRRVARFSERYRFARSAGYHKVSRSVLRAVIYGWRESR